MIDFSKLNKVRDELSSAIRSNDLSRLEAVLHPEDRLPWINLNYLDKEGQTPLHQACIVGSTAICKMLVEAGASQALKNAHGWYPIHLASYLGHVDVVVYLLECSSKEHVDPDIHVRTPHDFRCPRPASADADDDDDDDENNPSSSSDDDDDDADDTDGDDAEHHSSLDQIFLDDLIELKSLDISAKDFLF